MIESQFWSDVFDMTVVASICAALTLGVTSFFKKARKNNKVALAWQAAAMTGFCYLFLIGAGLQSVPGYPHYMIPVIFVAVFAVAHLLWRTALRDRSDR